jgi:hypothetical protein
MTGAEPVGLVLLVTFDTLEVIDNGEIASNVFVASAIARGLGSEVVDAGDLEQSARVRAEQLHVVVVSLTGFATYGGSGRA